MRWRLAIVLLVIASPVWAQEVIVGKPFTVVSSIDGMHQDGLRLYVDNVLVTEMAQPTLCAGIWSFGPAHETLRDGVHVGGGYGARDGTGEYRCIAGVVWVFAGETMPWWSWTGTAWIYRAPTAPTVDVVVEGITYQAGDHLVRVAVFRGSEESRSDPFMVTAVAGGEVITVRTPTGARVQ